MEKIDCQSPLANKMSSAQLRKIKKPIIEKRRRERINDSLNQLKALVLDAMQKDESRYSKMEKADILEMTVHHLKNVHRREKMMNANEEQDLSQKYTAGFTECAKEVSQFLATAGGLSEDVHQRVMTHLSKQVQQQQQHVRPQQISPTPIVVSPIYPEPHSPQAAHVPCATNIANLPGSPAQQYAMPQSISPVVMSQGSPVLVMSPASSTSSLSPAHSTSSINSAIPLYQYSPVSSYSSPPASPQLAEDAPSPTLYQQTRGTVISKPQSCHDQVRLSAHRNPAASMWRPW